MALIYDVLDLLKLNRLRRKYMVAQKSRRKYMVAQKSDYIITSKRTMALKPKLN